MTLRKNISVPESIWTSLVSSVPPGKRSQFISDAIQKALEKEEDLLAKEYEEAYSSEEYKQVQRDWNHLDTECWE